MTRLHTFLSIGILVLCFMGATYIGHTYEAYLIQLLETPTFIGYKFTYVALLILATVFAPLSTLPLIPIATTVWGPVVTALLNITGWFLGSVIAFYISRTYGLPLVHKFIAPKYINTIESYLPRHKHLLISIILLRMIIPVDVLSYALGLFPRITWRPYLIGSAIGIIPFSFIFAYVGGLPIQFQIIGLIIVLPILLIYLKLQHTSDTTS